LKSYEVNLLERLKAETRPAHRRIEQAVGIERRVSSLPSYRALLARFYGFHVVWEPEAATALGDPGFFDPRRKVHLLARDLMALGASEEELTRLPRLRTPLPPEDRATAWGALYVIEGSTLGGTLIAKQVERELGLTAGSGCSYFRSYGPDLGSMWKAFGWRLLDLSQPRFDDAVVASANRTFETLRAWLVDAGDPVAEIAPAPRAMEALA
jgi:heme oxygenase